MPYKHKYIIKSKINSFSVIKQEKIVGKIRYSFRDFAAYATFEENKIKFKSKSFFSNTILITNQDNKQIGEVKCSIWKDNPCITINETSYILKKEGFFSSGWIVYENSCHQTLQPNSKSIITYKNRKNVFSKTDSVLLLLTTLYLIRNKTIRGMIASIITILILRKI